MKNKKQIIHRDKSKGIARIKVVSLYKEHFDIIKSQPKGFVLSKFLQQKLNELKNHGKK